VDDSGGFKCNKQNFALPIRISFLKSNDAASIKYVQVSNQSLSAKFNLAIIIAFTSYLKYFEQLSLPQKTLLLVTH